MHWESWDSFFKMGGYGFYVWLSFGLTLLCLLIEWYGLRQRSKDLQEHLE